MASRVEGGQCAVADRQCRPGALLLLLLTFVCAGLGAGPWRRSPGRKAAPTNSSVARRATRCGSRTAAPTSRSRPSRRTSRTRSGKPTSCRAPPPAMAVTFFSDCAVPRGAECDGPLALSQHPRRWRMVDPGAGAADRPPLAARARVRVRAEPDRRPLGGDRQHRTGPRSGHGARPLLLSPRQRHRRLSAARPRHRHVRGRHGRRLAHHLRSPANSSCRTPRPDVVNLYEWDGAGRPVEN